MVFFWHEALKKIWARFSLANFLKTNFIPLDFPPPSCILYGGEQELVNEEAPRSGALRATRWDGRVMGRRSHRFKMYGKPNPKMNVLGWVFLSIFKISSIFDASCTQPSCNRRSRTAYFGVNPGRGFRTPHSDTNHRTACKTRQPPSPPLRR